MKLRIEATPAEMVEKSEDLVRALSNRLAPFDPHLADILEKALPYPEPDLKYPVLQHLKEQTSKLYKEHIEAMLGEIGKVLEGGDMQKSEIGEDWGDLAMGEALEKAGGPYIGPRGGKWADPEHTISWKENDNPHPEGFVAPTERHPDAKVLEKLTEWGEQLYETQQMDPLEQDSSGFSYYDMEVWRSVRSSGNVTRMRNLLRKYRRQLLGSKVHAEVDHEDLAEWIKLGMTDQVQDKTAPVTILASYHPTYGSLNLKLGGWVARDKFDKFMEVAWKYKLKPGGNGVVYIHRRDLADFDPEAYSKEVAELGWVVTPPEGGWHTERPVNAPAPVPVAVTAEEIRDGIQAKRVYNKIAVIRGDDGIFRFYSPFSREFNAVMSNKSGRLTGIIRTDPVTWARETHQLDLVEEAIVKLQEVHPDWEIVTSGVKEAQLERDTTLADLQKPIPGVAEKLDPRFKLFPYQNECVRFLDQADGNALIGDEMGLGKTLETLAWAVKGNKRLLIVCPKVVRRQWLSEAQKFFPGHFRGTELVSADIKKKRVPDLAGMNIAVVNYESLDKFEPYLKGAGFDTIVIDESHRMKSPKAKVTKNLQKAAAGMKHRILLSGTAVKNKRDDLITQLELVAPGKFADTKVTQVYVVPGTDERIPVKTKSKLKNSTIGGLWQDMRGVYLARSKHKVLKDLPDKITTVARINVPDLPDFDPRWEGSEKFERMSQLRNQIAVGKVPATVEFIQNILENSHDKVLVFSESVECTRQIQAALGDDTAIFNYGGLSDKVREENKAEFQRQDANGDFVSPKRVFVTTRPSLAEGANMTAANAVVFNDLPWTAAAIRQAEDRTHRPGQKKSVNVYWVTAADNAFDSNVQSIIEKKYALAKKQNQGLQLTAEEVAWMEKPVKMGDLMAQLSGHDVAPGVPVVTSEEDEAAAEAAMDANLDKSFIFSTSGHDQLQKGAGYGRDDAAGGRGYLGGGDGGALPLDRGEVLRDFPGEAEKPFAETSEWQVGNHAERAEKSLGSAVSSSEGYGGGADSSPPEPTESGRGLEGGAGFGNESPGAGNADEGDGYAPFALAHEIEMPADLVEALFGDLELSLEAGARRVRADGEPTRYFYRAADGHPEDFEWGSTFRVSGQTVRVKAAIGDLVKAEHAGQVYLVSPKEFSTLLYYHEDGWIQMEEAAGSEAFEKSLGQERAGHKYIRRVPKPGGGYTYFYRDSAIGRGPTAGESVKVGDRHIHVKAVDEESGKVTLHDGERDLEVGHEDWGKLLAEHYGEAYFASAEKRARQVVRAVAKHIPVEALAGLKEGTDTERLTELETRVPELHAKLAAAFKRAGLSMVQAKTILGDVLARRGWQPEARAVVIGSVVSEGGIQIANAYKSVMKGAENLAGAGVVEARHAQAAVELIRPQPKDHTDKLEAELTRLQGLIRAAMSGGDKARVAGILAHTMALSSEVLHQAQAMGVAYPGALGDSLVGGAREALLQVPAVAPRAKPTTEGAQTQVYVAGEGGKPQALRARYRLVDAGKLRASHDPLKNFAANPDYPAGVQERAYHRDLAEQAKVRTNAQKLTPAFLVNTNPDAVNGPPVVTEDGVVLGGNSRTMSMQLAYHEHPERAAELQAYLAEHAHEVGFKAEDVAAMQHPVLVRVLEGGERSKAELQLLVRQANESFTQSMDPRTMQVALARKLDDQTMKSLMLGMDKDETLNAFLGSKRVDGFIANLRRVGVIDARNVNQFLSPKTGKLNEDGKTLVARILVGKVIDNADLLAETGSKILASIAQSVPHMSQAAGFGAGYDLSGSLQTAMGAFNRLQERVEAGSLKGLDSKISDREIDSIMNNEFADMFGTRHPILEDSRAQEILRVLIKKPGPTQMSGVFQEYAALAAQNPEGQAVLGGKARTPEEVFHLSVEAATRKGSIEKSLAGELGFWTLEKGGPFIGPRGGKWADPEHTIAWKEPEAKQSKPAEGQKPEEPIAVNFHPVMLRNMHEQVTWNYRVVKREGGQVKLSRHEGLDYGPTMPEESVKHFQNDLAGKVDLPPAGRPEIDAVTSGKAEFLGKGDDGLVFKVGDQVVKVSTTVPYQPENPGHRTPEAAAEMLRKQVEVGNLLAGKGIPGIQRSEYVRHGDKGFQIKPWVEIPKTFTREQLDKIQDTVIGVHKAGYALRDSVQAGLDAKGEPVLFDVGKAGLQGKGTGIYSDIESDMDSLRKVYHESGEDFVRRDVNEGEQAWQRTTARFPKFFAEGKFKIARNNLKMAVDKRLQIARATLKGEELKSAESRIDFERLVYEGDIEDAEKKAAENPELKKAGGPYIGPKGGKWADPQHTISWEPEKPKEAEARKWETVKIVDTRDYDWETGKPIPGTGAGATCTRCERTHDVIHTMRHPETGEHREVGSGCGPKMAGGKENLDDASIDRAKTVAKKEMAEKFESQARKWLHAASKKIDEVIQEGRITHKPFYVGHTPVDPDMVRSEFSKKNWDTYAPLGQIRIYEDPEKTHEVLASRSPMDKENMLTQTVQGAYIHGIVDQVLQEIGVPEKTKWPVKLGRPFRSKDPRAALRQIIFHTLVHRYFAVGAGWGKPGYRWTEGHAEPSLTITKKNPRGIDLEKYPILQKSLEPEAEDFEDPTQEILEREALAYRRLKAVLARLGYSEADYDISGPLYGLSANQLLEVAQRGRK
jgi:superfamily II DNA or RNA helicase